MSHQINSFESFRRASPTLEMDGIEQAVALGRCLIGSIDLDLKLSTINAVNSQFKDSKQTPWLSFENDDGTKWYARVDGLAGRSQGEAPSGEVHPLKVNGDEHFATSAYMKMLAAQSSGLLESREPTYMEAERLRSSALTLSGVEGVAHEILSKFPTDGTETSVDSLIVAVKTLYRAFALSARQAAYLLAGAVVLKLWPQELVINSAAAEPPGDGPHKMREAIAEALRSPATPTMALSSEPLVFGVAPLLVGNRAGPVMDMIDTLMDDAAKRLNAAVQTSETLSDYQEQVFFAIPAALASMMISNSFRVGRRIWDVSVPDELIERDRRRHEVNTERWVRMDDALSFQAADIISGGRAWASLKLELESCRQKEGTQGALTLANRYVNARILSQRLGERLLLQDMG